MNQTYGEFSFNGHNCTEFGLHYAPKEQSRWLNEAEWETSDEEVTGRHGGYFYGTRVKIRTFKLECYFEDATIERLEAMQRWLNRNMEGKLIFDERPYVYYIARPSSPSSGKIWARTYSQSLNHTCSGTVTLEFKAYQPFGFLDRNSYTLADLTTYPDIANRTPLLLTSQMPSEPSATAGDFQVYNPGTEYTVPTFKFYGSAPNGLTITNNTTNETCTLVKFNMAEGKYLEVNGETGSVKIMPDDTYAFEYHTDGYISLAPSLPFYRNITLSSTSGSNQITFTSAMSDDVVGKYIYVNSNWYRIISLSSNGLTATLNSNVGATRTETTVIVVMNELTLAGDSLALTDFKIEYQPYVR